MTAPVLHANNELVAVAWLAGVTGLTPDMVATTLPKDPTVWANTGFVTAPTTVGGALPAGYAYRSPVVTVKCWATRPGSNKPPWGQAAHLASLVVDGCYAPDGRGTGSIRRVTLPGGYPGAQVTGAWIPTEPRRSYGDAGDYACYVLDLALRWVELGKEK